MSLDLGTGAYDNIKLYIWQYTGHRHRPLNRDNRLIGLSFSVTGPRRVATLLYPVIWYCIGLENTSSMHTLYCYKHLSACHACGPGLVTAVTGTVSFALSISPCTTFSWISESSRSGTKGSTLQAQGSDIDLLSIQLLYSPIKHQTKITRVHCFPNHK